ncbi:hypothetical protein C8R45DRAFT_1112854 [Mycena sanguinolenta]|nr:hypothetical protein C8R45DRAFT_1112854 [Mycena sanguinolenta]
MDQPSWSNTLRAALGCCFCFTRSIRLCAEYTHTNAHPLTIPLGAGRWRDDNVAAGPHTLSWHSHRRANAAAHIEAYFVWVRSVSEQGTRGERECNGESDGGDKAFHGTVLLRVEIRCRGEAQPATTAHRRPPPALDGAALTQLKTLRLRTSRALPPPSASLSRRNPIFPRPLNDNARSRDTLPPRAKHGVCNASPNRNDYTPDVSTPAYLPSTAAAATATSTFASCGRYPRASSRRREQLQEDEDPQTSTSTPLKVVILTDVARRARLSSALSLRPISTAHFYPSAQWQRQLESMAPHPPLDGGGGAPRDDDDDDRSDSGIPTPFLYLPPPKRPRTKKPCTSTRSSRAWPPSCRWVLEQVEVEWDVAFQRTKLEFGEWRAVFACGRYVFSLPFVPSFHLPLPSLLVPPCFFPLPPSLVLPSPSFLCPMSMSTCADTQFADRRRRYVKKANKNKNSLARNRTPPRRRSLTATTTSSPPPPRSISPHSSSPSGAAERRHLGGRRGAELHPSSLRQRPRSPRHSPTSPDTILALGVDFEHSTTGRSGCCARWITRSLQCGFLGVAAAPPFAYLPAVAGADDGDDSKSNGLAACRAVPTANSGSRRWREHSGARDHIRVTSSTSAFPLRLPPCPFASPARRWGTQLEDLISSLCLASPLSATQSQIAPRDTVPPLGVAIPPLGVAIPVDVRRRRDAGRRALNRDFPGNGGGTSPRSRSGTHKRTAKQRRTNKSQSSMTRLLLVLSASRIERAGSPWKLRAEHRVPILVTISQTENDGIHPKNKSATSTLAPPRLTSPRLPSPPHVPPPRFGPRSIFPLRRAAVHAAGRSPRSAEVAIPSLRDTRRRRPWHADAPARSQTPHLRVQANAQAAASGGGSPSMSSGRCSNSGSGTTYSRVLGPAPPRLHLRRLVSSTVSPPPPPPPPTTTSFVSHISANAWFPAPPLSASGGAAGVRYTAMDVADSFGAFADAYPSAYVGAEGREEDFDGLFGGFGVASIFSEAFDALPSYSNSHVGFGGAETKEKTRREGKR